MANYFNEEFETLPRAALEALQLKRLQAVRGDESMRRSRFIGNPSMLPVSAR